jgi:hypothetical protein
MTTKTLLKLESPLKFILMTPFDSITDFPAFKQALGHIDKPFRPEDL